MTIIIFYHLSGFKSFKNYYQTFILEILKSYFPKVVSYQRFVEYILRCWFFLIAFLKYRRRGEETGIYYADSKKLAVCDNLRIHSHKVFEGIAQRGKTSVGWFYGLKVFLVINERGQVMECMLTRGNVADNDFDFIQKLFGKLKGKVFADKGFIFSKIFQACLSKGLKVVTKIRDNMKNKLMDIEEKWFLNKRGIIESVFDILKTVCDIEHTRHRSAMSAVVSIFAAVVAYTFLDQLPSIAF